MKMDRRAFLSWVGVGALASSLPMAIAACTSENNVKATPEPSVPAAARTDGFTNVGSVKTLEQVGFITDKTFAAGPLLVVRNPADIKKLVAVNSTCPHKGCAVEWNGASKEFVCPCHGSKFKADGSVAEGPANKPLAKFTAKTEGDSVLVRTT
jgi:cytochrome b6-f complex iron-sulfur subunit